jgi:outer membrane protein assembly factor BamB
MPLLLLFLAILPQDPPIQQAWVVEFDDAILGAPSRHGDLVFAASKDGKVSAFRIDTGEPAWSFDAKGVVVSNLVVLKDRLFVPAKPNAAVLDPRTGKVVKDKIPNASRAIAGASRLYLLDSLAYISDQLHLNISATVAAYDPVWGTIVWEEKFRPGVTTAIESGGRLYVCGTDYVQSLDAGTGKKLGEAQHPHMGNALHGLADRNQVLFFTSVPWSVRSFDPKTLKEKWKNTDKRHVRDIPSILVADGILLFSLPDVVALDPKTGKELWTVKIEGEPYQFSSTPPAVRGTEVCVGSRSVLYAIDAAAGKATWSMGTGGLDWKGTVSQPVWIGDRLLYSVGRRLLCFKLK